MNDKVPLVIIIAVIIFILIFIVVIASYTDSSDNTKAIPFSNKKEKSNPLDYNTNIQNVVPIRILDSHIIEFNHLTDGESYIFGGSMNYSSVSIYKDDVLIYSKIYSGNNGFVVSNNQQNVNASFFQIGKKINLENLKYTYLPVTSDNSNVKIVISSIASENLKIFKCTFNYEISQSQKMVKISKDISTSFGISEYDIEKYIKKDLDDSNTYEKVLLQRSFDKKHKSNWNFHQDGNYIVYYIKGFYSFKITDSSTNILVEEINKIDKTSLKSLNSYINNDKVSIDHFYISNPRLDVINLDENIPEKNLNSDLIKLLNTPVEFYKHFVYGKKNVPIDIWNRINNKIMIFKI